MINRYRSYNSEVKRLIAQTGNIYLFPELQIPRTTALYWIQKAKIPLNNNSDDQDVTQKEIERLQKQLEIERRKVQLLKEAKAFEGKLKRYSKKISKTTKRKILDLIAKYQQYMTKSECLSLIGISKSTYTRWNAIFNKCNRTGNYQCSRRHHSQLTEEEIDNIRKLVTSKKFMHYSLTALYKYALRQKIIGCSQVTWFKYICLLSLKKFRVKPKKKKEQWKEGIRATKSNDVWHIDVTQIKLATKTIYVQAIIDNYSRFVVSWSITESISGLNTKKLINKAIKSINGSRGCLMMDKGTENINDIVTKFIIQNNLKRLIAKVDIKFSNSIIEALFRSMKNNFLYKRNFKHLDQIKRAISFYLREHNNKIPHSAFNGATPKEIYESAWSNKQEYELLNFKKEAILKRKNVNMAYTLCEACSA